MMKSELSSLLDGELEEERHSAVLSALRDDAELRSTWSSYHLMGDALRHASRLDMDLTARIMTDLQREPVILVPRRSGRAGEQKEPMRGAWLRYAAAVAGVGAVAWLALSEPTMTPAPNRASQTLPALAQATQATQAALDPVSKSPTIQTQEHSSDPHRLQAYLVAHQAYSPGNRFDGGAGYVRTVASVR